MFKELEIRDIKLPLLANGATPYHFKRLFGKDLLKQLTSTGEYEIASDEIPELAFIMAMQAEKADMAQLTFEKYIEWLEQFDALDMVMKSTEIADIYIGNTIPKEKPKKKASGKANA